MYHMRDVHQDVWIHTMRSTSGHVNIHDASQLSCIGVMRIYHMTSTSGYVDPHIEIYSRLCEYTSCFVTLVYRSL